MTESQPGAHPLRSWLSSVSAGWASPSPGGSAAENRAARRFQRLRPGGGRCGARADGYAVRTQTVDVSDAESVSALAVAAGELGPVVQVAHTAGLSPTQAPPAAILAVDLLGVAWCWMRSGRSSPRAAPEW